MLIVSRLAVSPFLNAGLYESFSLAVGAGRVGPGPHVPGFQALYNRSK